MKVVARPIWRAILLILAALTLFAAAACGAALAQQPALGTAPPTAPFEVPSSIPGPTATPVASLTPAPLPTIPAGVQDYFVLAMDDYGYSHLFAYAPASNGSASLPPVRLTTGPWDDSTPSVSPDGTKIAFASRRNGYQDLYLLDLATGETTRLTDTPEYDSHPSWSPDGQWIAFESYLDDNLEIQIKSVADPSQPAIRLTQDPAADYSPAWSPVGRQVAFVSTRSGNSDIWLASLDAAENRFTDVSNTPNSEESSPAWSPDGQWLAWASSGDGDTFSGVYALNLVAAAADPATGNPGLPARWLASGELPVWGSNGDLAARLSTPNSNALAAYHSDGTPAIAPIPFASEIYGMDWHTFRLPDPLPSPIEQAASAGAAPLYAPTRTAEEGLPPGRVATVPLTDVQAPYPQLHDDVNEAFEALRQRVIKETNWDALASLENAFVPLTTALDPGLGQDWLYTGRAFALNPLSMGAGWMLLTREDIEGQTYWRVYLRPQAQDGSQGEPLHALPWNLNARYDLDPNAYDQGGALLAQVPSGYWVDFTALARRYGFDRLPALPDWRTYARGARFNEFALTSGLTWHEAMLQLYPPEILVTPTAVVAPTRTPTRTPRFYRSPTPTPSSTPRPTFTTTP
jgi:TolB protein